MSRLLALAYVCLLVGLPLSAAPLPLPPDPGVQAKQKLHPILRAALKASKPRLRSLQKNFGVDADRGTAKVMIRVDSSVTKDALRALDPGIKPGTLSGGVLTAEVPLAVLDKVASLPGVRSVHLAVRYKPLNDVARSSTTSGGLALGTLSSQGEGGIGIFNGSGVVVGVVDTGLDFKHDDFVSGAGGSRQSRVLAMWDQTDTAGPNPSGFSVGSEWTQAQLTADILNNSSVVRQQDTGGHGTHVTGSAAGDGSATDGDEPAGKYAGMAPAADLVIVKTDFLGICDGADYIFRKAAVLGKPAVVNLSLGSHFGPHDGSSEMEDCLEALAGPGKVIVAAAGNEGAKAIHASRSGGGGDTFNMDFFAAASDEFADFWHDGGDAYTLTVTATDAVGSVVVTDGNLVEPTSSPNLGTAYVSAYNRVPGNTLGTGTNGAKEIFIYIFDPDQTLRFYHFQLTRTTSGGTGRVDAWTGLAGSIWQDKVDASMTVGMPATSPGIIAAGAYNSKKTWVADDNLTYSDNSISPGTISDFSSRGPTRDGRPKPDIAAPGQFIHSAMSANIATPFIGLIARDGKHFAEAGTSMASPITAGAVALRLQQNPLLTTAQVLSAMQLVARDDAQATGLPNNTWGSGKLLATPPAHPAPPGFAAAALSTTTVRWTWSDISNEAGYRVKRASDNVNVSGDLTAGSLSFDQTGLTPNSLQQAYVEAFNAGGATASSALTRYSLANPPASLAVSAVSSTTANLGWSANLNANGTLYEVSLSTDGFITHFSTPLPFIAAFTATTALLSNLEPDTPYAFRVRARNQDAAVTEFSAAASTATNVGLPRPITPVGTVLGVSSVTWTWGSQRQATGYNLFRAATNASLGTTGAASLLETGLTTNTAYGLKVTGLNVNGESPLTAGATVHTLAAPPLLPSVTAVGFSSAAASWQANGNPNGTVFTLEASRDGATVLASSRTVPAQARLDGLLPDTTYHLKVYAENGAGVRTAEVPLPDLLTMAAPPAGLLLTLRSTSSIRASWSANGNPADTPFELSLSRDGFATADSTPIAFSAASSATSLDMTGLAGDTTYFVRVRARNRAGALTAFASASLFLSDTLKESVPPGQSVSVTFGNVTLSVPARAFSEPVALAVRIPASFPAPASFAAELTAVGLGVEITNDLGLQPSRPLDLTLSYAGRAVADEKALVIARFEPSRGVWVPLISTPDPANDRVAARLDHLSLFQLMQASPAGALATAVIKAFPSPAKTSRGERVRFTGLPAGALLKVYTFRGVKVRSLIADGAGMADWDGRNDSGLAAASGVYLVLVESGGDDRTLKVMIER